MLVVPHISSEGRRLAQTAGRSGRPNRRQRLSGVSCTQRTPAGLPSGMPGIGDEIDGAIQQAPQPIRHSIIFDFGLTIDDGRQTTDPCKLCSLFPHLMPKMNENAPEVSIILLNPMVELANVRLVQKS